MRDGRELVGKAHCFSETGREAGDEACPWLPWKRPVCEHGPCASVDDLCVRAVGSSSSGWMFLVCVCVACGVLSVRALLEVEGPEGVKLRSQKQACHEWCFFKMSPLKSPG